MNVIRPGEKPVEKPINVEEIKKSVMIKDNNWYAQKALERNDLLDNMVSEWNEITVPYSKLLFVFCNKLSILRKQFEHDSFSKIIREFSNHPDIRNPPSPGRIWNFLKLLENKPEIMQAIEYPDKKDNQEKYYYKKDGTLFTEFYIELFGSRHALPNDVVRLLEKRGIKERWSYRKLLEKIHEATEDTTLMTQNDKLKKSHLIRKIIAKLKGLTVTQLEDLLNKMENAT